jgi:hypothetical protein
LVLVINIVGKAIAQAIFSNCEPILYNVLQIYLDCQAQSSNDGGQSSNAQAIFSSREPILYKVLQIYLSCQAQSSNDGGQS